VAGTLAAHWDEGETKVVGVCPDMKLYDLRVVDNDGIGDEYSALAALHFVQYRNASSDQPVIHGVNISMSIAHDVRSFACGRTPICEACSRLVGSGVVVVAAAGNRGYALFQDEKGRRTPGYRASSITDPGNCEDVITVGATHRHQPHKYGVSFFSSRGPTGDGRMKPDLVAPGEKINAPVPGDDTETLDGTSMAAPHVSGAAALLMARYSELIGEPRKIKHILCETATDLGRERNFQGAGMLDILRALQSV
jgi:subtilisin family serine protease